jgi:2-polyprenyl-3-methyl-5-hydroxy-6-metoxy-1,4-benzoquinol methylase
MDNALGKKFLSSLREKFLERRVDLFMTLMKPGQGVSVLDLGGEWGDFLARIKNRLQARFVVADIREEYRSTVEKKYGFEFVLVAEDKPLPFGDGEFDIVISNSVIEHVTLPKEACLAKIPQAQWISESWRRQQEFAAEIRRIATAYFVQTPHKNFPIETHTWLPFVNLLSHNQAAALVKFTDKHWIKHCGYVDWNLLRPVEMKTLFPEAALYIERFLGLPKSVIAYHR